MRAISLLIGGLIVLLSSGCSVALLYEPEIQQGNVVTQDMVDKLRPGMTPLQVRFVLGTPLVADPFHKDRWDYYYSLKPGRNKPTQQRRLTVIFKDNQLATIETSPPAAGEDAPFKIEAHIYTRKAPQPETEQARLRSSFSGAD